MKRSPLRRSKAAPRSRLGLGDGPSSAGAGTNTSLRRKDMDEKKEEKKSALEKLVIAIYHKIIESPKAKIATIEKKK